MTIPSLQTINGLYKTELTNPRGPWRTVDEVEYATAEYCADRPPVQREELYDAHPRDQQIAELSHP